ncbi:MAG: hypothetical protein KUA35_10365 [Pseudodesulfovibrio sp.]|uniref:Uncharacterized protein n=1 Tax=Pseudodesulfovibrio aespoeensis (strain ATCC 700646 / DSM 10631 / Aspo-2) TaxID=643562 RepID=E6VUC8_PSEA9|nr:MULTISPECIES: hypothetical protein [Pseudodesulfovibrio]MBU4192236.1 hypothetical protein [Pseudomonadota bacterium]ADU63435.1 hypothetical protein Daes_2430 [Pseudodesulfovibrio aespoeensis Aspo-2]MBU4243482.1 hypothetical protein [Pseudomonadota bacterium]MBU4380253.1 hypothetical protein [Pseudomonadota bacterium]MBU4473816.1 hypothetical protein [Pseudomonadota bacterium]
MPKCPQCKTMRPKEAFYTPRGYRCIACRDCRTARIVKQAPAPEPQPRALPEPKKPVAKYQNRAMGFCPYDGGGRWAGVDMQSINFAPLG